MLISETEERLYSHVCASCESAYLFDRASSFLARAGKVFDAAGFSIITIVLIFSLMSGGLICGISMLGFLFMGYLFF
mgnify:CR=1 FL=1